MRRAWLIGFSALALASFAQAQVGGRPSAPPTSDPRVGAGGIRTGNPNILYPGSPSGGQPGSILTPGTPRSPGASALPATPGAVPQVKPNPQGRPHRGGRVRGSRGYVPVYGYGYGGVYVDTGSGPAQVAREEETSTAGSANVITVPPREQKPAPRSRVYDVRETVDGNVEMTAIGASGNEPSSTEAASDYWLIALKGGLIYAADRYQERDDTFRFRTLEGKQFVVPLAEVDVAFTEKLNADQGKEFRLR